MKNVIIFQTLVLPANSISLQQAVTTFDAVVIKLEFSPNVCLHLCEFGRDIKLGEIMGSRWNVALITKVNLKILKYLQSFFGAMQETPAFRHCHTT